eukprot:1222861-Rhodomonas_salina.2
MACLCAWKARFWLDCVSCGSACGRREVLELRCVFEAGGSASSRSMEAWCCKWAGTLTVGTLTVK